jgi:hypothetical protein
VDRVFSLRFAKLLFLKPSRSIAFFLSSGVIPILTLCACQCYDFTRHKISPVSLYISDPNSPYELIGIAYFSNISRI